MVTEAMDEELVRSRCPFCLISSLSDIPIKYEGATATHQKCLDEYLRESRAVMEADPELAMRIAMATDHSDPAWGHHALQMLRGEVEPPPFDPFP